MAAERYCLRLEQASRFQRYETMPCAECGELVVHNEPDVRGVRFVCMECLLQDAAE